jgi:methyl-accepting chemotaxis protein
MMIWEASSNIARETINQQETAVTNALDGFDLMKQDIGQFVAKIEEIMKYTQIIENNKITVLSAIQNISAIIEETIASSEEVKYVVETQLSAADHLHTESRELNDYAADLNQSIGMFKFE